MSEVDEKFSKIIDTLENKYHLGYDEISDLLKEARNIAWTMLPDVENTTTWKYLQKHNERLRAFNKPSNSIKKKGEILSDVKEEFVLTLQNHIRKE